MKWRSLAPQMGFLVGVLLLVCTTPSGVLALEKKTFVAYSMKVAQARAEEAVRRGVDFRQKQPDLFYLGGITRPWAVVLDTQTEDWILVGERDPQSSVLTLDDWVASLRARLVHGERDPGVTIDPRPSEACLKAGKTEGCRDYTRQDVRFFGGIENTHFGQVCYEADWLMKKIGLALEKLPVKQLKSYYELSVEQAQKGGRANTRVASRFWFYPVVNRVNVWSDVVLLEKFQMGVFTEVLYAEVDSQPVVDVDKFEHYPSEGFSRSFSEYYDTAAEAREVLETLRGLTRLAALAKGLTQVDVKPKIGDFLTGYPKENTKTPKEVEVLKVGDRKVGLEISGGVSLTALAMRLQGGDVKALRELVLGARPSLGALSWEFEMQVEEGRLKGVVLPSEMTDPDQIAPLFAQAVFLQEKKRYDAAIEGYGKVLQISPDRVEAYGMRGYSHYLKGDYERAIADFNHALALKPDLAEAYNGRGLAYAAGKQEYDRAIADYNQTIELNPNSAAAYYNRGIAYAVGKREYQRALADFNQALILNPNDAEAYHNRGVAYSYEHNYPQALADFNQALALNPRYAPAYLTRGAVYAVAKGNYDRAIADYNQALALNPNYADAYLNRGSAYNEKRLYDQAVADYNKAIELNPKNANAYLGRGIVYAVAKGNYDRAIADYNQALALNPNYADAYLNRGIVHTVGKRDYDQALADYNKAIELNPKNADAYLNRGATYAAGKRDYDRAIADYNQALALNPKNFAFYNNRGIVYKEKGLYDRAIADFDQALALNPNYAQAYLNKAAACEAAKRLKEAVAAYRKFIELASALDLPNILRAREKLRTLEGKRR